MKDNILEVVIVMSRCSQSRNPFGIRFEKKAVGRWLADWAFPLKDSAARREGYDRSTITGSFGFEESYPGCPTCQSKGCFKCHCGKVGCWNVNNPNVTCPWCGSSLKIEGTIESLGAGGDR